MSLSGRSFPQRLAAIVPYFGERPLLLMLLVAVWLTATAWMRPLFVPDEGRYVGVALQMLQSHNWLTPKLDGLPFFHKPPLFYWITATSMKLFGINEWAARLAPFLGAWLAILTLFWFLDRQVNRRAAVIGVLVSSSLPMIYAGAQFASMDMLVGALIAITILLLAHVSNEMAAGRQANATLVLAYATSALGVMTKGMIGLVLPGMVLFFWLLLEQRYRHLYRLISIPGILAFLAIAAPWFWLEEGQYPGFLHYTFIYQQFDRYLEHSFNNPQPIYYYLLVLLGGLLPWSGLIVYLLLRPRGQGLWSSPVMRLAWIWIAAILVFFSIPTSKLIGYIMPTVPAFALILAIWLERRWPDDQAARTAQGRCPWIACLMTAGGAALGLVAVITFTLIDHKSLKDLATRLKPHIQPGEQVLFVDYYFYSVPFYLRDHWPVLFLGPWQEIHAAGGDSSANEFSTSAQFDPAMAQRVLIPAQRLQHLACGPTVTWAFLRDEDRRRFPLVTDFPEAFHSPRDKVGIYRLGGNGPKPAACAQATPGKTPRNG